MNEIKIFSKEEFGDVRVTELDGEPMFCLADVAKALEYVRPADAVTAHCKGVVILPTPTNGGVQQVKYGKESEVYRLVMKSKAKRAEAFQDWVCEEVLPSIRKTGTYSVPQTFAQALRLAAEQQEKIEEQQKIIELQKPKVEYFDKLVDRQLLTNFRDTAKEFGIKQTDFINSLLEKGYIYRDKKGNIKPYAQHTPELFEIKDYKSIDGKHVGSQTLITPKGKATFSLLLKPEINPF